MAHSGFLRLEVATIVFVRLDYNGNILHDFESVAFKADALYGIICDKTNLADSHLSKYLSANAILAFVGTEAEMDVRIHRIVALLLEFVGSNLVHESYAATFLTEIDDETFAFLLNHSHGFVKLFAAIATLTAKDVARHATRVHADKDWFVFSPLAFIEHNMFQSVAFLAERNDVEVPVGSRHIGFYASFYKRFLLESVGDEVANADDFQIVFQPLL